MRSISRVPTCLLTAIIFHSLASVGWTDPRQAGPVSPQAVGVSNNLNCSLSCLEPALEKCDIFHSQGTAMNNGSVNGLYQLVWEPFAREEGKTSLLPLPKHLGSPQGGQRGGCLQQGRN